MLMYEQSSELHIHIDNFCKQTVQQLTLINHIEVTGND